MSGGRNRRLQKESVSAFVPRNEIAKITTGGTEGHDAHPFCVCTYGNATVSAYQDGVGALFPFIIR